MTQEELGRRIGLKDGVQISRWESGEGPTPGARRLPELAQALHTTVAWLVDGSGKAPVAENVLRGTYEGRTSGEYLQPVRTGHELVGWVKEVEADYQKSVAEGASPETLAKIRQMLTRAVRIVFLRDPDPDRMAEIMVEMLLTPTPPEAPPGGHHGNPGDGGRPTEQRRKSGTHDR